jgi:hypothetical protein
MEPPEDRLPQPVMRIYINADGVQTYNWQRPVTVPKEETPWGSIALCVLGLVFLAISIVPKAEE